MNFKIFHTFPNLKYGLSKKADGPMPLALREGNDKIKDQNKKIFLKSRNIVPNSVIAAGQNHTTHVETVGKDIAGQSVSETDALITQDVNIYLTITAADCFPVFFYDPEKKVAALAHAGWRGTINGICKNVITEMAARFQSKPENIRVGLGPGIQQCHFEIRGDVLKYFQTYRSAIAEKHDQYFINLPQIITKQLLENGLISGNIENSGICTYCETGGYFSFRRDKPGNVQAMLAFIGMR